MKLFFGGKHLVDSSIRLTNLIINGNKTEFAKNEALSVPAMDDSSDSGKLIMFPNPATSELHIHTEEEAEIYLYTLTGDFILKRKKENKLLTIDLNHLARG